MKNALFKVLKQFGKLDHVLGFVNLVGHKTNACCEGDGASIPFVVVVTYGVLASQFIEENRQIR